MSTRGWTWHPGARRRHMAPAGSFILGAPQRASQRVVLGAMLYRCAAMKPVGRRIASRSTDSRSPKREWGTPKRRRRSPSLTRRTTTRTRRVATPAWPWRPDEIVGQRIGPGLQDRRIEGPKGPQKGNSIPSILFILSKDRVDSVHPVSTPCDECGPRRGPVQVFGQYSYQRKNRAAENWTRPRATGGFRLCRMCATGCLSASAAKTHELDQSMSTPAWTWHPAAAQA